MKEKKFDENVENIYKTLSDEQKAEYIAKENKMNKVMLVVGIITSIIVVAIVIWGTIALIPEKDYGLLAFVLGFGILCALITVFFIYSSAIALKTTDEAKVKTRIKRLEKQKQWKQEQEQKKLQAELQKNVHYRLQTDKIKNVTILDSYTEWSEKLHAVLNYQEVIQTRVYKFSVTYDDGISKVITAAENSEEYTVLMPLVGKMTEQPKQSQPNNIEKLREYKKLLDDGIITQDEFDKKKKELL